MNNNTPNLQFNRFRALPLILQDERAECGHACIAMISQFWGHDLTLSTLRSLRQPSIRGISLYEINQLFEDLGFLSRAIRVPLEKLAAIRLPALLHWNMNHFVVLKKIHRKGAIIHDPAQGVRDCTWAEISDSFSGIALEVERALDFKKIKSKNHFTLYALFKTFKNANYVLASLFLLSLALEAVGILHPLLIQYVTDNVVSLNNYHNLYSIGIIYLYIAFLQIALEYARGHIIIFFSHHFTEKLSSSIFSHLLKFPLDFFEKRHKANIQSKFQVIEHIQKKITSDFVNTALDGLLAIINLIFMLFYSQRLTLVVIVALLFRFLFRYCSYQHTKKHTESAIYQQIQASTHFLETLQGIPSIKSFVKEKIRLNLWRNCNIKALNANIKVAKQNLSDQIINQFIFHLEHIVIICSGASLIISNQLTVGMLMAFLTYRLLLVNKATSFMQNMFYYHLMRLQISRLGDLVFHECEPSSTGLGQIKKRIKGELTLDKISYKYHQNEHFILNSMSFHVAPGEKVALVGPSGCGKSTALKIMIGLLEKTSGEIYLDGISLKQFGLKNYRKHIAAVLQDDRLFTGSILDNLVFFEEKIDLDYLFHLTQLLNIHDTICQLPMGYETRLGEMGSSLSGGQQQRILIARALYKKPKILFLDEATSHLDAENESKINAALKSFHMTQIVIAHRQETIRMADRVLSFEKVNRASRNVLPSA